PRAKRRRLPVVLLEADVVLARVDAARLQAFEVELLHFVGRRLQDDLILMMLEHAVRILPEPTVVGPPRRLHVRHAPRLRTEHAQQRLRMRGAGADLEVERLLQHAPVRGPEGGEFEDEILKSHAGGRWCCRRRSRSTRSDFNCFSRCIVISARCTCSSSFNAARGTGTLPTCCGVTLRDAARNAIASSDSVPRASGYTPCNRRSQYSK